MYMHDGNAYGGGTLYFVNDVMSTTAPTEGTPHVVTLPDHEDKKIGAINNVFGGGNEAQVEGNTTVNIGTTDDEYLLITDDLTVNTTDVGGYYTRTNTGTEAKPVFTYTIVAEGTKAAANTNYYRKMSVQGADIRGNVYGGGNEAIVTGNTNVVIGKQSVPSVTP